MEGTVLEQAYAVLLFTFQKVLSFTFNDMLFFEGGFSFGNLIMTASLAWIVIKTLTSRFLERERIQHTDYYAKRKDVDTNG